MPKPTRILFVCTGNSARSQMAEAWAKYYGGERVVADSAGTQSQGINPNAVWAMNEVGINILHQSSDPLSDKMLDNFDYIVTLCGDARERCPSLPPGTRSEHWNIPDPAAVIGSSRDVIGAFRVVRYHIEQKVCDLLARVT